MLASASAARSATDYCLLFFSELRGGAREPLDALAQAGEARVVGLPPPVAEEDLLQDDGELEDGEDLVEADARRVSPRAPAVAFQNLLAREPALAVRHRRDGVAPRARHGRVHPVAEQDA